MNFCLKYFSFATATLLLTLHPLPLTPSFSLLPAQAQTSQSRRNQALQLYQKAGQLYEEGQYREALQILQQALVFFREVGSRTEVGAILNNIGLVYRNLGEYPQALEFLGQALTIQKEVGNREEEATTLDVLAGVYESQGQYAKALEFFQQALTIRQAMGNKDGIGTTLNNMGQLYQQLGQYSQALTYYEQSLAINKELANKAGVGLSLHNIGGIYYEVRQYDRALEFLQQSLTINRELGNKADERGTLSSIGEVYRQQGQYPKALEFHQQALAIYKQVGDKAGEGAALNNIGIVYFGLNENSKALEFSKQALAIYREIGQKAGEAIALSNIANALMKSGNIIEAEKMLRAAISVQESLRPGLRDADKVSIFETQTDAYRDLQKALIAQNKTEAALEISERGRARAFVELLATRLGRATDQTTINSPNIEQIKQIAKTQKATLVEYSIMYDSGKKTDLFIWVIKPTGEISFRQVDLKSLPNSLDDFVTSSRESIGVRGRGIAVQVRPDERSQLQKLQQLHQILIKPIADILPTEPAARVIFIPQDALFLVAFPALKDTSGKYLIEQHTILTAPAIQLLDFTRQQRQRISEKDVLVVGNPTMPSLPSELGKPPEQLPSLPGAEREAKAIATLLSTQAITGNQATKAKILQQLPNAGIIHLATHGLLDDFSGFQSSIALAPSGKDDGLLTVREIISLKLNAQLAILSACDTGRGRISGDGVIGLSRAFIGAGVSSVIVSLWSIPDGPTAFLMTEFYQNMQKNIDKAQALRQAMLTTMKQNPNPRDWAAFTLIGEAE
ncbi:CHAT domain-containing protein [Argonema antarcticum]|uniref:CHAT domain-containing protein n=1 Tax=Argonema antarcticum TaxID=2942763 RepID=UPI00201312C3|nr:CHAT domain-containing tetratricopeptide repeat protein [Argonema antarcticum]MCL1471124.1 CHAT domain-containing protein [Argonema antarcticum A004/B2]